MNTDKSTPGAAATSTSPSTGSTLITRTEEEKRQAWVSKHIKWMQTKHECSPYVSHWFSDNERVKESTYIEQCLKASEDTIVGLPHPWWMTFRIVTIMAEDYCTAEQYESQKQWCRDALTNPQQEDRVIEWACNHPESLIGRVIERLPKGLKGLHEFSEW